jgi:ferric-dicitrate binding protein FerR (iron transport regulator)
MKNKDLTENFWEKLASDDRTIDVDRAWNRVYSRIKDSEPESLVAAKGRILRMSFLRIAAAIILLAVTGGVAILVTRQSATDTKVFASADTRNMQVDLPDGSRVFLNRNSELAYDNSFGEDGRNVKLTGEAFFDITPDASKPFRIDAGKAVVEVVGTSFSVLTENSESQVEVFVKTGKVAIERKSGERELLLEPGFLGKIGTDASVKTVNDDPNYLAWNTGNLLYKGEKLEVVFRDLKKVYNMEIVADDPSIAEYQWTSSIDYQPQDNIIRMICLSFNLSYSKDGDVYHLSKK